MRYFLQLAYRGATFHGWQSQPNAVSVQSTIEDSLSLILRTPVNITGAGRTDTGVNARIMYAHFDCKKPVEDKFKFLLSLNRLVGKEIAIYDLLPVEDNSHARFDAVSRTYKYFISQRKDPFHGKLFFQCGKYPDMEAMNKAAAILPDTSDFTSFAKLHSDVKTNICKVTDACWKPIHEDQEAFDFMGSQHHGLVFTISADRFLRNMVRAIVGTLLDVGRGRISIEDFQNIIKAKDRCLAGSSAPPEALFLWDIKYPFLQQNKSSISIKES